MHARHLSRASTKDFCDCLWFPVRGDWTARLSWERPDVAWAWAGLCSSFEVLVFVGSRWGGKWAVLSCSLFGIRQIWYASDRGMPS